MKITTVGIDLARNVFQIHGIDEHGKAVLKKQLRRDQMAAFFVNLPSGQNQGAFSAKWQHGDLTLKEERHKRVCPGLH